MMMMDVFSVFDPVCFMRNLPLNWIFMALLLFILACALMDSASRIEAFYTKILNLIMGELKILLGKIWHNFVMMFLGVFTFVFGMNFLGLFPYIFTSTSHLSVTLAIAFPFFVMYLLYSSMDFYKNFMAHLVPLGTPFVLMPFMVLIESVSLCIRPVTLSVRLMVNIVAGHLLLVLMSSMVEGCSNKFSVFMVLSLQCILIFLEVFVSYIQSYVFVVLAALYSSEL